jgi:hypothetical protein
MTVEITKDNVSKIFKSMADLVGKAVYVGIPESENPRGEDAEINNAALGYIHEFGDPKTNIPARPFLIPGVQNVEKQAIAELKKSTEAALSGDQKGSDQGMNRAGIIASNEVKRVINSNIPPPLKPDTVRKRYRSRGTKGRRDNENLYLSLIAKGIDPGTAQDQAGIVALIDTGQLRNSITYVVRKK